MLNVRNSVLREKKSKEFDFEIALAGNPNVGKSTVFNALTGLKQHTGNWTGKTVSNAVGSSKFNEYNIKVVDLPGIYSLYPQSEEEKVANDYLNNNNASCVIVVVDSTNLERNLNLVLQILNVTDKVLLCLNLCDEAKKKGVYIDAEELSLQLGIPVVKTSASKKQGLDELINTAIKLNNDEIKTYRVADITKLFDDDYKVYIENIYRKSSEICSKCLYTPDELNESTLKLDKIITSKAFGIPIMLLMLSVIFWITIVGANYLSDYLSFFFEYIKRGLIYLFDVINMNEVLKDFIINGVYTTLVWVVSVMLPPMAIFFPIFSLLEDSGLLPRIAFNLDSCFCKAGAHGKQSLTIAMGFGCNACGVMGCRIIDSERERNIAILTNSFIPCNGRLPTLIAISSIFIANSVYSAVNSIITTLIIVLLIVVSIYVTLFVSKMLSKTILKGQASSFILELPPYRKPKFMKTVLYSLKDRAWFVLLRAVTVAIPAGAVIWIMANVTIHDTALLNYCTGFLEPFGKAFGLDGTIIMAFILGLPANEIVIPIILMSYTKGSVLTGFANLSELSQILISNGWTLTTAICFLIICIFHFPCSTTCLTIYKETRSIKITLLSFFIPTIIGLSLCLVINLLSSFRIFF
ncbi:MAG: ferrous iron transporter B [Ruminococcus sp.]|nr:ferrous iron transporter B [Ruminococcus sp.]